MFASKTPRDLNRDPYPWRMRESRDPWASRWASRVPAPGEMPRIYDPRPEYDHPQHNAPNPILVAFRERGDAEYPGEWLSALDAHRMFGGYTEWDDSRSYFHPIVMASHSHRRHARRVLERLARMDGR